MAIIIPSKNTYKKQNPKVRDNVIERIEVGAVEVVPDNEYETPVYNKNFLVGELNLTSKNTLNRKIVGEAITMGADAGINAVWVANAEISNQKILNKKITIPKIKENKWIYSLLYEKDKDGKNQIKYTIHGNIQKGSCSQSVSWELPDKLLINPIKPNFTNVGNIVFNTATEENTGKTFDYYSNITSSYKGTPHSTFNEREISATLEPNDISNVISFQDNENEFIISIDIMASIIVSKLGGSSYESAVGGTFNITGTYEKYIPTEIEITVYGNTIGIDLTDKTVYINGETAKKVHRIDGNELMQTSNYLKDVKEVKLVQGTDYTVEYEMRNGIEYAHIAFPNYEKYFGMKAVVHVYENIQDEFYGTQVIEITGTTITVDNGGYYIGGVEVFLLDDNQINSSFLQLKSLYSKGKETATILCDINDYFSENREKKKSGSPIPIEKIIRDFITISKTQIGSGTMPRTNFTARISITPQEDISLQILYNTNQFTEIIIKKGTMVGSSMILGAVSSYSLYSTTPEVIIEKKYDMCFKIGDQVIPMVYGSDGKDKPMSTYQNGTPKKFQVLGTKIFYDGAVWQELNLQEI